MLVCDHGKCPSFPHPVPAASLLSWCGFSEVWESVIHTLPLCYPPKVVWFLQNTEQFLLVLLAVVAILAWGTNFCPQGLHISLSRKAGPEPRRSRVNCFRRGQQLCLQLQADCLLT